MKARIKIDALVDLPDGIELGRVSPVQPLVLAYDGADGTYIEMKMTAHTFDYDLQEIEEYRPSAERLIKPLMDDGTTRRCGSLHRREQCLFEHEHGGTDHQSPNHTWPMHVPMVPMVQS